MFFKLKSIVKNGKVLKNKSLKNYTSFKIGGKAKYIVEPSSFTELIELINYLNKQKIKHFVLGNGTNVLASDNGFNGVIISTKGLNTIRMFSDVVQVFAGANLNTVCKFYLDNNMGGFESAFGIPGTVGGAVKMNASAYDFETSKMVLGVFALTNGKVEYYNNLQCEFSYRNSVFKNSVILMVEFKKGNTGCDKCKMNYVMQTRKSLQPLNLPSAGSVFKREQGVAVSKIIDELGLKGLTVGGAKVSEKHAGFIVNFNNATAKDVKELIKIIKAEVLKLRGIELTEEINFIEN